MTSTKKTAAFAEVIESSLVHCKGQTWQWDNFPEFGSLLCIKEPTKTVFGIVTHVTTGAPDTGRTPFIYQKTESELKREHPHIFAFLQTTFVCTLVAFVEHERFFYQTASTPAKIHAFIEQPTLQEQRQFFTKHDYLFTLHAQNQLKSSDLLVALLRQQHLLGILTKQHFFTCLETVALLEGDNYARTAVLIERTGHLVKDA